MLIFGHFYALQSLFHANPFFPLSNFWSPLASVTCFEHRCLQQINTDSFVFIQTWQRNMSNMGRAKFPWDPDSPEPQPPPPVSQPAPQAPPPAPTPAQQAPPIKTEAPAQQAPPTNNAPHLPLNNPAPIKQEQNFDTSMFNLPAMPPTGAYNQNPHYAQQRALSNIQQRFGNTGAIGVGQSNGHGGTPDYSSQPPAKRIKTEGGLGSSQTDGAGDDVVDSDHSIAWRDIVAAKNGLSSEQRAAADGMMRREAEAIQQRLEAGGLLVPLDQRRSSRKANSKHSRRLPRRTATSPLSASGPSAPPQHDGAADDDDEDEKNVDSDDAINSDLDDSDDENDESALQGDSHQGDMMLCLYDKVQRVKNKWKCQLKDGVITIGDKE